MQSRTGRLTLVVVACTLIAGIATVTKTVAGTAGTAADVAAVKRDVVLNLRRDAMIMRSRDVPADLQTQLAEVYAASVLETVTGETAAAMRAAAADPGYQTYDDYRFVPTQWQGVQATPAAATVTVLGYDSWGSDGTWENDEVLQRQMVLANEAGRWKIVEQAAFDPAERSAKREVLDGLPRMR